HSLRGTGSGQRSFAGQVGSNTPLSSLSTDGGGTTRINGGAVSTSGAQDYKDAVTVGGVAVVTTLAGGSVNFENTLNSVDSTPRDLVVNSAGVTTFGAVVGGTFKLQNLTTDAAGSTAINTTAISTSGDQT